MTRRARFDESGRRGKRRGAWAWESGGRVRESRGRDGRARRGTAKGARGNVTCVNGRLTVPRHGVTARIWTVDPSVCVWTVGTLSRGLCMPAPRGRFTVDRCRSEWRCDKAPVPQFRGGPVSALSVCVGQPSCGTAAFDLAFDVEPPARCTKSRRYPTYRCPKCRGQI